MSSKFFFTLGFWVELPQILGFVFSVHPSDARDEKLCKRPDSIQVFAPLPADQPWAPYQVSVGKPALHACRVGGLSVQRAALPRRSIWKYYPISLL